MYSIGGYNNRTLNHQSFRPDPQDSYPQQQRFESHESYHPRRYQEDYPPQEQEQEETYGSYALQTMGGRQDEGRRAGGDAFWLASDDRSSKSRVTPWCVAVGVVISLCSVGIPLLIIGAILIFAGDSDSMT
jgi:hypothetical protein